MRRLLACVAFAGISLAASSRAEAQWRRPWHPFHRQQVVLVPLEPVQPQVWIIYVPQPQPGPAPSPWPQPAPEPRPQPYLPQPQPQPQPAPSPNRPVFPEF